MKIAVVGAGYVGLVSGTCFAESGHEVVCIDKDESKIEVLRQGSIPIYEPYLQEMVQRNLDDGRLSFTTDMREGVAAARVVFIAVGTPQREDGAADLTTVWAVVDELCSAIQSPKIVVIKSTVPVGTNAEAARRLAEKCKFPVDVASNPEFLKEGSAVADCLRPDRVVVGTRRPEVTNVLHSLYETFLRTERPFLVMSPESAEMTKYVANALLATKISFINEMANLCEKIGADIDDVRRGIGHDERIGFKFLFPGPGFGGSCFPKDIRALKYLSSQQSSTSHIMQAVDTINEAQKRVLGKKVREHFGGVLAGRTLAVWGLSFKPGTDDIREAPALTFIDEMLAAGVALRVHDPEAMDNVRKEYGAKLVYCDRPYGALEGADGLVVVTEWQQFRNPDFELMRRLLKVPVVFDGRNILDPRELARLGFTYYGIGRQPVKPGA